MQKASEVVSQANNNNNNRRPVAYAFIYVNSPATKEQYPKRLKMFFDSCGLPPVSPPRAKKNTKTTKEESVKRKQKFMEDLEQQAQAFLERARLDNTWTAEQLMFYLDHHKERVFNKNHKEGHITAGTLHNLLKPIRLFLEAYPDIDGTINWKRIKKALPKAKLYANDRSPTIQELRKLVEYHDRRIKPLVYTMCSSGIRVGAWQSMRWKDITPIKDEETGEIIAARLLVYPGEGEEYITFMTPEAFRAISEWMDFRDSYGEQITPDSWVMRSLWRTVDVKRKHAGNISKINQPERLTEKAIIRILIRALDQQGIRPELPKDARRHPFQGAHGMRKWFKTRAEQAMLRTNVEYVIGHSLGLSQSYYRPTEHELLTDYVKAVPLLTISLNLTDVKKQQDALEERQKEKESEIQELREEQQKMREMMAASMRTMASMTKMLTSVEPKEGTAATIPPDKMNNWIKDTTSMLKTYIEQEEEKSFKQ